MNVDVLAVGAHSDDVEIGIAGIVYKLTQQGHSVAILDLTRAEMSTRGNPEERVGEAEDAAKILGVKTRENVGLPDAGLENNAAQQRKIIPFIQSFRPKILLAPMREDRHPDHNVAHALLRDAAYFSGLSKISTGHPTYRPDRVYYYHPYYEGAQQPHMIIDISEHFEKKIEALKAYKSQFHNPDYQGEETYISSLEFWKSIEIAARYWGKRIGVDYGEPLFSDEPLKLSTLPGLENIT